VTTKSSGEDLNDWNKLNEERAKQSIKCIIDHCLSSYNALHAKSPSTDLLLCTLLAVDEDVKVVLTEVFLCRFDLRSFVLLRAK